jgi:hypothetical protein
MTNMAKSKKMQTILETSALAIVVIVPIVAISWYVLGGNDASQAAPAPTTAAATAPATQSQTPSVPASGTGTVTLDSPSALPTAVTTGEIVPFSFAISNTGASQGAFSYKVYVKWNSGVEDVIDLNSVTLASGASTDISEALKFETASAKGQVYITLQPSGPTINFALPRI